MFSDDQDAQGVVQETMMVDRLPEYLSQYAGMDTMVMQTLAEKSSIKGTDRKYSRLIRKAGSSSYEKKAVPGADIGTAFNSHKVYMEIQPKAFATELIRIMAAKTGHRYCIIT